jgi:hypothetical protein
MDSRGMNRGYGCAYKEVRMKTQAEEILENVVWLVTQCDDDALARRRDLPFLELAKYVSYRPPLSRLRKGRDGWEQSSHRSKRASIEL